MSVFFYYFGHTFVNSIKKLFKSWVAVFLAIIVGFALIGGIAGAVIGSVVDDNTESTSVSEPEKPESAAEKAADKAMTMEIVELAVGGIALSVILLNIYQGDKNGAAIFTMPDVNFLFQSPMQPQSVLMFRTILQMGLALLSSLYLLFQLPNLTLNAGLPLGTGLMLLIAWFFILFLAKLAAVCTYTITATHISLRKYIRPFVIAVAAVLLGLFLAVRFNTGKSSFETAVLLFASPKGRLIPVFGWLRGLVLFSAEGRWLQSILCFLGLCAVCVLLTVVIWHIRADFYEDALAGAAKMQERLDNAKAGKNARRKKPRSEKIARNGELTGEGAQVFYTKSLYNRRRFAKFGALSATCGTYTLLALAACLFCQYILHHSYFEIAGGILLVAVYFRNLGNPATDETGSNFLYLVPESPYKKVFYLLAGLTVNAALDLLPPVLLSAVILKIQPLAALPWYLAAVTLELFCSSAGLFIEIILPSSVVPAIRNMLQAMLRMAAILPGFILLIIGISLLHPLLAASGAAVVNILFSALLFAVTPGFLHLGKR